MSLSILAKRFIVRGDVQGVGYRWFVRQRARILKIDGWVRNRPDGTVEVWAEGTAELLDEFYELLNQGPPMASVDFVEFTDVNVSGRHSRFDIQ